MNDDDNSRATDSSSIRFDNADQQFWSYAWQYKRTGLIWCMVLLVTVMMLTAAYFFNLLPVTGSGSNGLALIFFAIIIPLLIVYGWIRLVKKTMVDGMLQQFAARNGYSYTASSPVDMTYGTLFRIGGEWEVSDLVQGNYAGHAIELFLYELDTPAGKNSEEYDTTVLRVAMAGTLPNMLLMPGHRKKGKRLSYENYFEISNTIRLEGDFSDRFTLFALPQNQVEALQVFTPDVMSLIEDAAGGFIVEFTGNQILLYADDYVATAAELQRLFNLAKKLVDTLTPVAAELADEVTIPVVPTNAAVAAANKRFLSDGVASYLAMLIFAAIVVAIFIITHKPTAP